MEIPLNFKNAPSNFSFSFDVEEHDQKKSIPDKKKKVNQAGILPFQRLFPQVDEKLKEIADNHKFGALPSKKKKIAAEGEWSLFKREELVEEWSKYKQEHSQDYKKKRKYSLKKSQKLSTNKKNT